mgnify:FL=1|jgi:transcriptional regulator with XRE-family HTH domain|tara:strand:- start:1436 stop:1843 length:408 start_codon:yes stop_codon:yes gene_type:complete
MKKEVKVTLDLIRSRIREERESRGLSQGYMAEKLEVSRPYYCQLESGARQLSTRRLITIASALNVRLDKLCKPRRQTVVVEPEEVMPRKLSPEIEEAILQAKKKREAIASTGYSESKAKTARVAVVMQSQWTYHP